MDWIGLVFGVLVSIIVGQAAYSWGFEDGQRMIHRRDYVQARAGFFIDGLDGNKVYRLVPVEARP